MAMPSRDEVLNTSELRTNMQALEDQGLFTWDNCIELWEAYTSNDAATRREKAGLKLLNELQKIDRAHSIRLRHKNPLSFIRKIILKKVSDVLKYGALNADNYYKIITDLIGVRILIRYKHEWLSVHNSLKDLFDKDKKRLITRADDYISLYEDDAIKRSYFVEYPLAYIRRGDDKSIYMADGSEIVKIEESKYDYRSIHYIIKFHNQYVEIQVRTIFEEGWSECDHELVYKEAEGYRKIMQRNSSRILSNIAHQADELSTFMFQVGKGELMNLPNHCDPDKCKVVIDEERKK